MFNKVSFSDISDIDLLDESIIDEYVNIITIIQLFLIFIVG